MQNKKEGNHWFILIAVIIIIIIVLVLSAVNTTNYSEREKEINRRNEEEEKLAAELAELESKKEIYIKHESIHAFTEKYMVDLCEKRYRQLIRVLIVLLIITNIMIYFLVSDLKILDLFSWNASILVLVNLFALFFFANVKKGKEYLKGLAMDYIEFRVYENRDKAYFTQKVKFYNEEIEKIKNEILIKKNALDKLKAIEKNPNNLP
jgi:hypothetical protein